MWGHGVPQSIVNAASHLYINKKNERLKSLTRQLDSIASVRANVVKVAAVDLDNDGICGVAVQLNISNGKEGSYIPFRVFENGNTKYYADNSPASIQKPGEVAVKIQKNQMFWFNEKLTNNYFSYK